MTQTQSSMVDTSTQYEGWKFMIYKQMLQTHERQEIIFTSGTLRWNLQSNDVQLHI